jgi:hypothetical protein
MSDERLAELEAYHHEYGINGATDGDSVISELLTEVRRSRTAQPPLSDEYGLRIRHISTLTEERAIADTLDGALEVLAAFDAKGREGVVSRELLVRGVEEWRKVAGR